MSLNPNELNDSVYDLDNLNLNIFHTNVRTLNNFDSVNEMFGKCSTLPDVIALTETRLKKGKIIPDLNNYSFECKDSPTEAGGVGVYVSNDLTYCISKDLCLNVNHCKNVWLKIKTNEGKDLIIGIIYRHPGHHFQHFRDKLCENIYKINMSKSNYVITGDMNINLLKYNLASNVTESGGEGVRSQLPRPKVGR